MFTQCSDIPKPSQLILPRWRTWLKVVFYYNKKDADAIQKNQVVFQHPHAKAKLQCIHNGIEKLPNLSLLLVESLQMDDVHSLQ